MGDRTQRRCAVLSVVPEVHPLTLPAPPTPPHPQVNRANTPWVIMNVHTPLYNTNLNKHTSDPNAPSSWSTVPVEQQQYGMLKQFEAAFFKKYSVNFVFAGHVHTYERFQAMYNGTAADATGTVFMSVGTGGSVGDFGGYPPYTDAKGVRWTQNGKVWIASNCLLTKTLEINI